MRTLLFMLAGGFLGLVATVLTFVALHALGLDPGHVGSFAIGVVFGFAGSTGGQIYAETSA